MSRGTTDLTELNVVGITEGSGTKATFDAIPGLELSSEVVRVKPLGESRQEDIVYTVVIKPDRHGGRQHRTKVRPVPSRGSITVMLPH